MEKIDYGDINKFLASLGIVIIAMSIIVPYLYLKEDYGLIIRMDDIGSLTEPSLNIIETKQEAVLFIQKYIPWLSCILFFVGVIILTVGVCRWRKRQDKLDKKLDIEIGKAEFELKALTPKEVEAKAKSEVIITDGSTQYPAHKYIQIENGIINRLKSYSSDNFAVLPNQGVNSKYRSMIEIDILLKSLKSNLQDRIIEIKYYKNQSQFLNRTESVVGRLERNLNIYNRATNSDAVAVFVLVYSAENSNERHIQEVVDKFKSYIESSTISSYIIETISEQDINTFSPYNLMADDIEIYHNANSDNQ